MTTRFLIATLALALTTAAASAQPTPAPSEQDKASQRDQPAPLPAPEEPAPEEDKGDQDTDALPSLDDLLGLEPAQSDQPDVQGRPEVDPERAELERALTGEQVADMFVQAVQQMGDAADLLERAQSTGASTQRLQDEIVRKLDTLIEQAKQQQQQQASSSSSSSDPSQQQQQQPNQPQSQQQQAQQSSPNNKPQDTTPPERQDGPLADRLDEMRAAWGALPERVREALSQGSGDQFSSFYKAMTESYYRKLAGDRSERENDR